MLHLAILCIKKKQNKTKQNKRNDVSKPQKKERKQKQREKYLSLAHWTGHEKRKNQKTKKTKLLIRLQYKWEKDKKR